MFRKLALAAFAIVGVAAQSTNKSVHDPIRPSSQDGSSFANIDFIRTVDFNLTMNVDFDKEMITATNLITLVAIQDVSEIVLDY